jgi:hypothetical protein
MTDTFQMDLRRKLDEANPNAIADILKLVKLGTSISRIKVVVTGLTAAAAIDITTAAVKAAATITGITLGDDAGLPPIGTVESLRVTGVGTGALGPRMTCDQGSTPAAPPTATAYAGASIGLTRLNDDGKTLTFEGTVTGFILIYTPRTEVPLDDAWPPST